MRQITEEARDLMDSVRREFADRLRPLREVEDDILAKVRNELLQEKNAVGSNSDSQLKIPGFEKQKENFGDREIR